MPPDTVKVDRSTRWGNPFVADTPSARAHAVAQFRAYIGDPQNQAFVDDATRVLRGKNLACWCPLEGPCHADVLLEVVNR